MEYFNITLHQLATILITTFFIYFFIIIIVKLNGLRSFAKMSSHGFVVTLAIGSICASTVTSKDPSLLQGMVSITALLGIQSMFSLWRLYRNKPRIENRPLLLMDGSKILEGNLIKAKVTRQDLIAKLREANVLDFSEVRAVVFEQTGDISVLHGDKELSPSLLEGVRE